MEQNIKKMLNYFKKHGGVVRFSSIIKAGFHPDTLSALEKEGEMIHTRHILIQGLDFESWFAERLQQAVIWVPLFGFYWNADLGLVRAHQSDIELETGNWAPDTTEATE